MGKAHVEIQAPRAPGIFPSSLPDALPICCHVRPSRGDDASTAPGQRYARRSRGARGPGVVVDRWEKHTSKFKHHAPPESSLLPYPTLFRSAVTFDLPVAMMRARPPASGTHGGAVERCGRVLCV